MAVLNASRGWILTTTCVPIATCEWVVSLTHQGEAILSAGWCGPDAIARRSDSAAAH